MTNEAQKYAEGIADEVRALDKALAGGDEAAQALVDLEMTDREDAEGDWFGLWLNESALDVSVRVDTRGHDWGATVIVLRTVGGPRCEVVWDSHDASNVEVLAWWGRDIGRERITVDHIAARFEELVELNFPASAPSTATSVFRHRRET